MITFNGSQKEFFKAYPKEKRSLNETYKLINSAGEVEYKFVGGLGEKCFKKFVKNDTELKENDTELKETENIKKKESKPKGKILRKWEQKWEEKYGRSYDEIWSELSWEYGFTTSPENAYSCLKDAYDKIQGILTDEEKICCEDILATFKLWRKFPTEDYYDFFVKVSKRIKSPKIKDKLGKAYISYLYSYWDYHNRLESSYKDFVVKHVDQ